MKRCFRCGNEKCLEEFGSDKSRYDGKQPRCKQCIREVSAEFRKNNPEKRIAATAKYREANRDKCRMAHAAWKQKDPDRALRVKRSWVQRNIERSRATKSKWRAENRGLLKTKDQMNRHHTAIQILALLKKQRHRCACCKKSVRNGYHRDHIVPVSRGGTNDIENIQILCPTCNTSKGAKNAIVFMQQRGMLL